MTVVRLLLLLTLWLPCGAAIAGVWVALADGGREYAEAAEAIRTQLASHELMVRPWKEVVATGAPGAAVVITLGSAAYAGIVEAHANGRWGKTPVIAALLPRASFEAQRRRSVVPGSAVWLDQPFARQMHLLKLSFGTGSRIGVLLGPESRQWQTQLEKTSQDAGLQLNVYRVDDAQGLHAEVQHLLEENDVLFALPDPLVFNSGSVQNILLATYRQRIPMMGFSPAYVRAGAAIALYSTPSQIGQQAARLARLVLQGQPLPAPQMPVEFQVGVNANVARSLGLRLSEEALQLGLQNREGQ